MTKITTVGLELAKSVFQVHGADQDGRPVMRKKLRWGQVLRFFAGPVRANQLEAASEVL